MKKAFITIILICSTGLIFFGLRFYLDYSEYNKAQSSESIEHLEQYLKDYPDGYYSKEAQITLESFYYNLAYNSGSLENIQKYLNKYPNGRYINEVNEALISLEMNQLKKNESIDQYYQYINLNKGTSKENEALHQLFNYVESHFNEISIYKKLKKDFPNSVIDRKINNKLKDLSTWTMYYGDEEIDGIIDILATKDNGFLGLFNLETKVREGVIIDDKKVQRLVKISESGKIIWSKDFSQKTYGYCRSISNYNEKTCLETTEGIYFLDNKGEILDSQIKLDSIIGKYDIVDCILFFNDHIYLACRDENLKAFLVKVSLFEGIQSRFTYSSDYESEINALSMDTYGNLYAVGKEKFKGTLLLKMDNDLGLHFIKNDFPSNWAWGNSIHLTQDSSILISGYSSNVKDKNIYICKLNMSGEMLWSKEEINGISYGTKNILETDNNYIITGQLKRGNYKDIQVIKLNKNGDIKSKEYYGGKYDETSKCIVGSEDSYLVAGVSNGHYDNKPGFWDVFLIKCNDSFSGIGDKIIIADIGIQNTDIILDLNNKSQINDFLKFYRFDYFMYGSKNNYSFNLTFYPYSEENGIFSWTMFTLRRNGSWDVTAEREYKYNISDLKDGKLYFKSNIGEVYLKNDGTMVMHDTSRDEYYYFSYSKN